MTASNHSPGKWRQLMAAVMINLGSYTTGMAASWTSIMLPELQKPDNSLGIPAMSKNAAAWQASSMSIGILLSLLFVPYLSELVGRRKTAIVGIYICTVSWLLKLFPVNAYFLLSSQLLVGMGDGLYSMTVPPYITEMASNKIRGRLGGLFILSIKLGYLSTFVLDAFMSHKLLTACCLIAPVVQLVGMLFIPETPVYFIRKNQVEQAERSLMWFRGYDKTTVETELYSLEQFNQKLKQSKSSLGFRDLFNDRANRKGLLISVTMVINQQVSGISVMVMYVVIILDAAKTSVDTKLSSIIYASLQLLGCWLLTLTVDRCGRRPLLLISSTGLITSYIILGIFFTLQTSGYDVTHYNWLPVLALGLYALSYGTGVGPLTTVVANEAVNPDLATICNSIHFVGFSVLAIIFTRIFPILTGAIGFQNCFFIFAAMCSIGFFVILTFIPETKGKSIEAIRNELQGLDGQQNETVRNRAV